ncbi:protein NRT1/ PTR FAMILY 1.1-like [Prosopis cineraria]|uniref:protein NRT1/ PTR FAMILY 1.1-like n=1 Tax=Prosopis cineraria TaxID=364024 RepID=UPI0024103C9C|nr:protein NRT1/ PTR FAMILY 1.1-like [Prosopis cineraria]
MEEQNEAKNLLQISTTKKGGLITMPFIIANEALEKVANVGLHVNMIIYLMQEYHYDTAGAAVIMSLWNAVSHFMTIFGAFLSDSYLGRFRVISFAIIFQLLGLIVLWLTAIIHNARPPKCNFYLEAACASPSAGQVLFLVSSLVLMTVGAGGIRPCSLAFAADQISNPENPRNKSIMKSFFNWYYVSVGVSLGFSVTFIVYIQIKTGWIKGFGITVGLMLISCVMFFLGSPLYIKPKPNKNLCFGLAQVAAAAWKNRHLTLPPKGFGNWYSKDGAKLVEPTDKLRFLNKACMIRNKASDLDSNGMPMNPWSLCTVRQVEELKALIKVMPIWSTGFLVAAGLNQLAFLVAQATTMDRHLLFHFEVPATNFIVFTILSMTIWIAIYDRVLVPLISKSKCTRIRGGFTLKQRIGIGIVLTILAHTTGAEVERRRRSLAIREGLVRNPKGIVSMSAWWLVPQFCLTGLAEAFNAIGQIEFYYTQFPKSMSSIAVAFFAVGMGVGNVLAGLIVTIVKEVTQRGGTQSWLARNPNNGHYDYFYWLFAILNVVNLLYFFLCSWAYGSTQDIEIWDEEDDTKVKSTEDIDAT